MRIDEITDLQEALNYLRGFKVLTGEYHEKLRIAVNKLHELGALLKLLTDENARLRKKCNEP